MNKLLLTVGACLLLAACDASPPANDEVAMHDSDLTGNRGRVLATHDAARYTYIEVHSNGQNIWLAGPRVDLDVGDVIRWGDVAVMRDFTSNELNRTFETVLFVAAVVKDGQAASSDVQVSSVTNSGVVQSTQDAAGYTYVEVSVDDAQVVWLATPEVSLNVGDLVTWTGGSLMTDFRSRTLDRVFPEILFVQSLVTPGTE